MISIHQAAIEHEQGWRALWASYCAGAVQDEVSAATWRRIIDPLSSIGAVVALAADRQVVGFACFVVHECTWELQPVCYVEDLIVHKQFRGPKLSVGHRLGEHLLSRLHSGEWARLYGITRADNVLAQRLYGAVAKGEPYVRYVVKAAACA